MKNIPKKYLSTKFGHEARALIRKWSIESESDIWLVKNLIEAYGSAKEQDRRHIGLLLAMVFDLYSPQAARECAERFGIAPSINRSIGETIFADGYQTDASIFWRKMFSTKVQSWHPLTEEIDNKKYPLVVPPSKVKSVFTIDRSDSIYAFRQNDGTIKLVIINSTKDDILIDEELFVDEPPLYFTEKSHFVSPVFKLKAVKNILEFILAEIGYPPVRIEMAALFSSPQAYLINEADYLPGGCNENQWIGVSSIMRKDHPNDYMLDSISDFFRCNDSLQSVENSMSSILLYALAATAIIYEYMNIDNRELMPNYKQLAKLCAEYDIFNK